MKFNRRNFIKTTAFAGIGMAVNPSKMLSKPVSTRKESINKDSVAIGFIGVGNRGCGLLNLILKEKGVRVPAICDVNPAAIKKAQKLLIDHGQKEADTYMENEYSWKKLLERKDIDGVVIATTWNWHVPIALGAMQANKYVGLEVPAALTLEDCWELVNTHEKTGTKLMFLENCCYDRECMAILQMVREGLFGKPSHATCGYRHSSYGSSKWLDPNIDLTNKQTRKLREFSLLKNADQYPTHGVGPVANWLDINCGNRFLYLTSTSTASNVIPDYVRNHPKGGPDHPNAKRNWKQGNIITTVVKTQREETIVINYDNFLPRPYSRDYSLQGTNAAWSGLYLKRGIYIHEKSPEDQWEMGKDYDKYMNEYDHPLWKNFYESAQNAGHGGIDYFTIKAFADAVKEDAYPPIDVYDAVTWSAIIPLSERSIANGSTPEFFPDFTRGRWETRKPHFGII